MNVGAESIGFSLPFKDRRSGRDRRKYLDPRYRNPAYPVFVDRRETQRRRPVYDDISPLVKEHPFRKWLVIISILVAVFLACLFLFASFAARERGGQERRPKGTVFLGSYGIEDIPSTSTGQAALTKKSLTT
jgi:hypothetical protein